MFLKGMLVHACKSCGSHLTAKRFLISKDYRGKYGKAHLYKKAVNILEGKREKRSMTTGVHIIKELKCAICEKYVGWKYIVAYEKDQKFKEGKFILEKTLFKKLDKSIE
ncbi:hypothetical protein BB559_006031 [Furculomyces boomerangus]|uniref:Protein yippee-like n=1 Tax=Furculomyces boomerangus TaxID=61424 RepID=A0A2T9Y593_9FUNG|nr:hypothetical protein BB559_006031 [Furculomyces boomerangus]